MKTHRDDILLRLRSLAEIAGMTNEQMHDAADTFVRCNIPPVLISLPIVPILRGWGNLDAVEVEGIRARHVLELLRR